MGEPTSIHLIGCGVLAADLRQLADSLGLSLVATFLPAGLHDRPDELRCRLQQAIDAADKDGSCRCIVIAYGICGQGTVGLRAGRVPLVFPRVHDCIALFLGSDQAYRREFAKFPGTFYQTAGWAEAKGLDAAEGDRKVYVGSETLGSQALLQRFGAKGAARVTAFFEGWKKNYQRAAFIDTGLSGKRQEVARQRAAAMAKENGWAFAELAGDLSLLRRLLISERSDEAILVVPPGWVTVYSALVSGLDCAPPAEGAPRRGASGAAWEEGPAVAGEGTGEHVARALRYGLGIDAGGTYTDALVYDFSEKRILCKSKALTTRWDFSVGIGEALDGLDAQALAKVELVAVSTTLATNAIVEGEGQKTGLLLMNNVGLACHSMVEHQPKRGISGYIDIGGREVVPLDEEEVRTAVRHMMEHDKVSAFAVSGFAGTINPAHELRVKEIIEEECGLAVCCGHQFSDRLDFAVRAQTAVLNARIIPLMLRFFEDLRILLQRRYIDVPVMVVKGDGTLMSASMARERPVETILSGPAASVAGARVLTGLADATVIDMGGTTSDIAEIHHGRVAVQERGARVGGYFTHVRALDMHTVGLGGDSLIRWTKTGFTIGPKRVIPLACAAWHDPQGMLEAVRRLGARSSLRGEQTFLFAVPGAQPSLHVEGRERAILDLLKEKPMALQEVAAQLGVVAPRFLPLERLLQGGAVSLCGLTPTDLLHYRGSYRRWPVEVVGEVLGSLASALACAAAELVDRLLRQVEETLAAELFHHVVLRQGLPEEGLHLFAGEGEAGAKTARYLVDCLLGLKSSHSHSLQATFLRPIIGVGAPVAFFLPGAAGRFGCPILLPDDGDVANALGAITSQVLVRRRLAIRPDGYGRFVVDGVSGAPSFASLETAEKWARVHLRTVILDEARHAGTSGAAVAIHVDDRIVASSGGVPIFLERVLLGSLSGRPDPTAIGR